MLRLKRYDIAIKDGFWYKQPETGYRFDGNTGWRAQLRQIRTHRKGNNLPRQSLQEIADDLEAFTCSRLPAMCVDQQAKAANNAVTVQAKVLQVRTGGCHT